VEFQQVVESYNTPTASVRNAEAELKTPGPPGLRSMRSSNRPSFRDPPAWLHGLRASIRDVQSLPASNTPPVETLPPGAPVALPPAAAVPVGPAAPPAVAPARHAPRLESGQAGDTATSSFSAPAFCGTVAASSRAPQSAPDGHHPTAFEVVYIGYTHQFIYCFSRVTVAELFVELLNRI
jgi:hypothetical protein